MDKQELKPDFDPEILRVLRGGGWHYSARGARVAGRGWGDPADRSGNLGFRLVHDINHQQGEHNVSDSSP